ncbi:MAG: hypothetical protein II680_08750 [Clostridia bacterium]|nr:hypothetical protein [Clostridia bacterium]
MNASKRFLPALLALLLAAIPACSLRSSEETDRPADKPETSVLTPDDPSGGVGETNAPSAPVTDPGPAPVDPGANDPAPEDVVPISPVAQREEPDADADFYPDGLFIYGNAVYTQAYYAEQNADWFAKTALYYKQLFGCRVSVIIAPLSSMTIQNPKITSVIPDQNEILDKMKALTDPSVNFVDTYDALIGHRDEYLFFHTDHHWTQRGAYYAYAAFAESVGFTPVPLSSMTYAIRNDNYSGSMYEWTKNEKVKTFEDKIEAWYPTKAHTMTVVTPEGETLNFNSSIIDMNDTYVTFIAGDNTYTLITVPDNPQDLCCLVLKDSFGNAFIPFLTEHYGQILVVDPRKEEGNIFDKYAWMNFTDIIFINNIEAANSYAWPKLYMGAVGVALP